MVKTTSSVLWYQNEIFQMEKTLTFPRHVNRKSFHSPHYEKIKQWSVSKNLSLTYDIVEEDGRLTNSIFSIFHASLVSFLITLSFNKYCVLRSQRWGSIKSFILFMRDGLSKPGNALVMKCGYCIFVARLKKDYSSMWDHLLNILWQAHQAPCMATFPITIME